MNWTEQQAGSRKATEVSEAKAKLFEEVKKDLPVVQKEADGGVRPFKPVQLQPVKGVHTFEGEFGIKDEDVIFHFWPWGYHDAERNGERPPMFAHYPDARLYSEGAFKELLQKTVGAVFMNRTEISFDADIGAWFVKAIGYANSQFHRQLSIDACESLHKAMGGEES